MRHLALLTTLFDSILVYGEDGKVLNRIGGGTDFENVLTDERLTALRDRLQDCLAGTGFETHHSIADHDRSRWRGVPFATEDGHPAAILAIEHTHSRQHAKLSGAEFDFVLSNMRQGFWRRNSKGVVVNVNDHLAYLLEYTPEEMIGRHVSEFVPNHVDREGRYETEFVTKYGIRRRGIVSSAVIMGPKGRMTGVIDVVTDITAEHAMRNRLMAEVQKMSKLASTDALTGLANRLEFQDELDLLTGEEQQEPFALVMVDLDNFKEVNDRFGHSAGDDVLVEFALRLRQAVRESDLVARLGGDEFAVLLIGTKRTLAMEIVERLIERLRYSMAIGDELVPIAASIGWAHSDDGTERILQKADRRMYLDKRSRKGA